MPKLCFVINSLEGGGAERVISNLANCFDKKKGFNVTLICLNTADIKYKLAPSIKAINLVERKKSDFIHRMYYMVKTMYKLNRTLKTENPSCVISFTTTVNLWTGINCILLKIPYIVSERTAPEYSLQAYNKPLQWFSSLIYGKSKAIVIPASKMELAFNKIQNFKYLKNFKTIKNPVNVFEKINPHQVYHKKYILSVGRLDYYKGFDMLIQAFSLLKTTDVDLLISGEGIDQLKLQTLISELNLTERVKLIGFQADMENYYAQSEVFVLASRVEGYPNALVEAMSLGCACVAMDCDFGPAEIIENRKNGLLVPLGDILGLSSAIDQLLSNQELRTSISVNAKRINTTNSMENISKQWEKLILSYD